MSEQNKDLVRTVLRPGCERARFGRGRGTSSPMSEPRRECGKGCFFYFQAFPDLHISLDEFVAEGGPCLPSLDNDRALMTASSRASPQQDATLPSSQPRCTGLPTASSSAIGAWWRSRA